MLKGWAASFAPDGHERANLVLCFCWRWQVACKAVAVPGSCSWHPPAWKMGWNQLLGISINYPFCAQGALASCCSAPSWGTGKDGVSCSFSIDWPSNSLPPLCGLVGVGFCSCTLSCLKDHEQITKSLLLAVRRRGAARLHESPLEHLQLGHWLCFSLVAPCLYGFVVVFFLPSVSNPSLNLHKLYSQVSQKLLSSVVTWYTFPLVHQLYKAWYFFFPCKMWNSHLGWPIYDSWMSFPPSDCIWEPDVYENFNLCDQREAQEPPGLALLLNLGAGVLQVVSKVKYNCRVWNLRGYK